MSKYNEIGKRSFKAKWRLYIFEKVIISKLDEITFSDFQQFNLSNELLKKYANEYWQEFKEYKINNKTVAEIYDEIQSFEGNNLSTIKYLERKYIEDDFSNIFSKPDFDKLKGKDTCHYCKITITEINELGKKRKIRKKNFRGWNLEVDRLEPNKEYFKENCVMSCYWCNNAKTDEFTEDEFMLIGKEVGNILRNRLR